MPVDPQALYQSLGTWASIERLVRDQTPESIHLEFKRREHDAKSPTTLSTSDRERIGKAMSAFANSSGGVLVLGIREAEQGNKRLNHAGTLAPFPHAEDCGRDFDGLQRTFTEPVVRGVRHQVIASTDDPDRGVLVILVPESGDRPHRAGTSAGRNSGRYYHRVGTNSDLMPHEQLRMMFRGVVPAGFRVRFELQPRALSEEEEDEEELKGPSPVPRTIKVTAFNAGPGHLRGALLRLRIWPATPAKHDAPREPNRSHRAHPRATSGWTVTQCAEDAGPYDFEFRSPPGEDLFPKQERAIGLIDIKLRYEVVYLWAELVVADQPLAFVVAARQTWLSPDYESERLFVEISPESKS